MTRRLDLRFVFGISESIWVLSLGAENLDLIFVFDVLVVWGFELWV